MHAARFLSQGRKGITIVARIAGEGSARCAGWETVDNTPGTTLADPWLRAGPQWGLIVDPPVTFDGQGCGLDPQAWISTFDPYFAYIEPLGGANHRPPDSVKIHY